MTCGHITSSFFFLNDPAPTEIYTLPLHDALPISHAEADPDRKKQPRQQRPLANRDEPVGVEPLRQECGEDRKSTRLNSSHSQISYAVFCLKKKKTPAWMNNDVDAIRPFTIVRTRR